jgi:hypothetical protein
LVEEVVKNLKNKASCFLTWRNYWPVNLAKEYEVLWAKVAEDDLTSIIKTKASSLNSFPERGHIVPSLKSKEFHNIEN